jgi:hypothetical protein
MILETEFATDEDGYAGYVRSVPVELQCQDTADFQQYSGSAQVNTCSLLLPLRKMVIPFTPSR